MKDHYWCEDCERAFDSEEAGVEYEWEGEGVMRGRIGFLVCPYCGGDSYVEAVQCEDCEEWFSENDINVVGEACHKWCDNCLQSLREEIEDYMKTTWVKMKKATVGAAT